MRLALMPARMQYGPEWRQVDLLQPLGTSTFGDFRGMPTANAEG